MPALVQLPLPQAQLVQILYLPARGSA